MKRFPDRIDLVYDLTIEDAHCFYAAGALVSNCHDGLQYLALPFVAIEIPGAGKKALPAWMQKVHAQNKASRPYMHRGGRIA